MRRSLTLVPALALVLAGGGCGSADRPARQWRPPVAWPNAPLDPSRAGAFREAGSLDLSGPFDLARAIELSAERNPRVAAARSRWQAAVARSRHVGALPDPIVAYMPMLEHIETRVGPMEWQAQVTQRVPFPGKLSAAAGMAEEEARVRGLEYRIALRDTVADAKAAYTEYVFLHRAVRIVDQTRALAAQLAEQATARNATTGGEEPDVASLFDVLKAQAQLAQLDYDRLTLMELVQAETARLNALLRRAPEAPIGDPADLPFRPLDAGREELYALALAHRQELRAAGHRIGAAREAERLAELEWAPDFTIGATYTAIGDAAMPVSGSGQDAIALNLGLSIPLWVAKNRARAAEARHRRQAAEHERQAETDDLMARIARIHFRLENAERLVRLHRESLLPQAEQAMQIVEQWHATGRDTFGRLLEARSVWLRFQLAAHRALADHEQMVARLEQLVGKSLGDRRRKERSDAAE